jgi:phosphotransferase system  glucose/maltose/N-acetylglucosamine-specific IIC component
VATLLLLWHQHVVCGCVTHAAQARFPGTTDVPLLLLLLLLVLLLLVLLVLLLLQ